MWQPTTAAGGIWPAMLSSLLVSCHAASLHRTAEDSSVKRLEQIFPSLTALANLVAGVEDALLTPGPQAGMQLLHSRFGLPNPAAGAKEYASGSAVEDVAAPPPPPPPSTSSDEAGGVTLKFDDGGGARGAVLVGDDDGSGDTGRDEGMFKLPPLPYAYDALEPHIDAETMKFHHDFHHKTYVDKLNGAMAGKEKATLVELMPEARESEINNALGGTYNHCLFFATMAPPSDGGGAAVEGSLAHAIDQEFGSFDKFKEAWEKAATGLFGSGWVWLTVTSERQLKIVATPNQDNPLMDGFAETFASPAALMTGKRWYAIPILGLDLWEHAYYLKHQNRRPEYVKAFWNVVKWKTVAENFEKAAQGPPTPCCGGINDDYEP